MSGISPLQRFLGLPEGVDNPFDLLGLSPESAGEQAVRDALARRLERVARHAFGAGHEADEVRLALHAAAAQLSDPAVRALLSRQRALQHSGALPPLTAVADGGPSFDMDLGLDPLAGANASIIAFRMAALPLFLSRGGLNRRSRHRLVALAHAHGLDVSDVRAALRVASRPVVRAPRENGSRLERASPESAAASAPGGATRKTIYDDLKGVSEAEAARVARKVRSAMLGIGIILGVTALIVTAGLLLSRNGESGGAKGARAPRADPGTLSVPLNKGPAPEARAREKAPIVVLAPEESIRALSAATSLLKTDPGEAAWRFEEAAAPLARTWTRIDRLRLGPVVEATAEFIHRAEPGFPASRRAVAGVGAGAEPLADRDHPLDADGVLPALWSVGVLTRLAREGETTGATADEVRSLLSAALPEAPAGDATFWAGVESGLRAMIPLLPRAGDDAAARSKVRTAWTRWREGIAALPPENADNRNALLLAAAERLLTTPPSPATDPLARDTLASLLSALPWRAAADVPSTGARAPVAAQVKLLQWLDDPRMSPGDLAVVTEWLVARSDAPGVGAAMILPRDADARARAILRDRLGALWRAPVPSSATVGDSAKKTQSDPSHAAWAKAAYAEVRRSVDSSLKTEALKHACALARLGQAGALLWRSDSAASDAILASPADSLKSAKGAAGGDAPAFGPAAPNDGAWAVRYLAALPALPARLEAMAALERHDVGLGPVDAEVLAEAALLDTSADVRERAARIVRRRAGEATVVNGLLAALPAAPRRAPTSTLIADITGWHLPSPGDSSWPVVARRALADRLLEIVAGAGDYSVADAMGDALASAYRGQLEPRADSSANVPPRPLRPGEDAALAAEALWQERRSEAERSLSGVDADAITALKRKHDGRLSLAAGPMQRFAATQTGVMEITALLAGAERPEQRGAIERILADAGDRRRRAANVASQIEASERALLQLWLIRIDQPTAAGTEAHP